MSRPTVGQRGRHAEVSGRMGPIVPLTNPAEEAIMGVLRASMRPLTAREVWHETQKVRAIELGRTWELLWALVDRQLIRTEAGVGPAGAGRTWHV